MSPDKPGLLGKIRQRLAGKPAMDETVDEKVRPIIREVRTTMKGQPQDKVLAELNRRLAAAGIEVPDRMVGELRSVAARISAAG